ncbi:unnamed protein product [Cyprideis torosa]|uniref:Semaphorin-2A n=1 Tax=Cyprideis torosa TaxID=163714 RepID=A0A7R8W985_9CRUS|nr:unnamed protein product [Cyprideis torosa]CAG0887062.1 unnamed protein product [Cyprideis torosa]
MRAGSSSSGPLGAPSGPTFAQGSVTDSTTFSCLAKRENALDFSCGRLFYRTFHIDRQRDFLYVGAMDRIFRLPLRNINRTDCEGDSMILDASNVASCISKGKSKDFECRNHIRVIQPMGNGEKLYVCGTNAYQPKDLVIYSNLSRLARHEHVPGVGDGIAKCPFDPTDNSTALWVEKGNPGGYPGLYSGTVAEFTKADTVIFRMDLVDPITKRKKYNFKRTLKYNSNWLDKPNFVGSYEIGEYVYFFFRETAVEYINCGKAVYSRVARVCKSDTGGKNILSDNWATYLKARLNCSIPGEFPFYFNEIQSVYQSSGDPSRFHASFTTSLNGITGTAICTFTLRSITDAFNGKFKEQANFSSAWLPVLSSRVPEPRPGTCVNDTQDLPDSVLNFIRSHALMDEAVSHEHSKPVFFRRDVLFTRLAVDPDPLRHARGRGLPSATVFFAGTSEGRVFKILQFIDEHGESQSQLLDVFDATTPEAITNMDISPEHNSLYVASDNRLRQINMAACADRYDTCIQCVRDPHCGWDRATGSCHPFRLGLLQDLTGVGSGICASAVSKKRMTVHWGQTVHLGCPHSSLYISGPSSQSGLVWTHVGRGDGNRRAIVYSPNKRISTSERGLVIIGVTEADAGRYDCIQDGSLICSFNITVESTRCGPPAVTEDYQRVYSDWCHTFERYKHAVKSWEKKKGQCGLEPERISHPNEIFQTSRN